MIKVYGASGNTIKIENSAYDTDEIGSYCADTRIEFDDSTVISLHFTRSDKRWNITVGNKGSASQRLTHNIKGEANIYSDIFEIEAEVISHEVLDW